MWSAAEPEHCLAPPPPRPAARPEHLRGEASRRCRLV